MTGHYHKFMNIYSVKKKNNSLEVKKNIYIYK